MSLFDTYKSFDKKIRTQILALATQVELNRQIEGTKKQIEGPKK